jgi:hypothetical protein
VGRSPRDQDVATGEERDTGAAHVVVLPRRAHVIGGAARAAGGVVQLGAGEPALPGAAAYDEDAAVERPGGTVWPRTVVSEPVMDHWPVAGSNSSPEARAVNPAGRPSRTPGSSGLTPAARQACSPEPDLRRDFDGADHRSPRTWPLRPGSSSSGRFPALGSSIGSRAARGPRRPSTCSTGRSRATACGTTAGGVRSSSCGAVLHDVADCGARCVAGTVRSSASGDAPAPGARQRRGRTASESHAGRERRGRPVLRPHTGTRPRMCHVAYDRKAESR